MIQSQRCPDEVANCRAYSCLLSAQRLVGSGLRFAEPQRLRIRAPLYDLLRDAHHLTSASLTEQSPPKSTIFPLQVSKCSLAATGLRLATMAPASQCRCSSQSASAHSRTSNPAGHRPSPRERSPAARSSSNLPATRQRRGNSTRPAKTNQLRCCSARASSQPGAASEPPSSSSG